MKVYLVLDSKTLGRQEILEHLVDVLTDIQHRSDLDIEKISFDEEDFKFPDYSRYPSNIPWSNPIVYQGPTCTNNTTNPSDDLTTVISSNLGGSNGGENQLNSSVQQEVQ